MNRKSLLNGDATNSGPGTISDKVNLLTYNIFLRPPGINNNGNDYKNGRLKMFCSSVLSFYDIVCLQEMFAFGSNRRGRLISQAKLCGLPYSRASSLPCFLTGIDGGLVILSRFPIVRTNELTFTHASHSDAMSHKGALYAKICIRDNFHFHVFNTHTQASYENNPPLSDKSVQIRLEQIGELRKFIDETLVSKPADEPVFLMGDLNVNSRVEATENDNRSSPEYLAMYQILCEGNTSLTNNLVGEVSLSFRNFHDLLFERAGYHPVTYGDAITTSDGKFLPRETILTHPVDYMSAQSLDYMFYLDESKDKEHNGAPRSNYKAEIHQVQVEEMMYEQPNSKFPCTQLSDHYGVGAQVLLRRI